MANEQGQPRLSLPRQTYRDLGGLQDRARAVQNRKEPKVLKARAPAAAGSRTPRVQVVEEAERFIAEARLQAEVNRAVSLVGGFFRDISSFTIEYLQDPEAKEASAHLVLLVGSAMERRAFREASANFLLELRARGCARLYGLLSVVRA